LRFTSDKYLYLLGTVIVLILFIVTNDFPFFWDTLLTSSVLNYFDKQGIGNLILPEQFDAGHPPFFYLYLYGWILLLGKKLYVVHLAMLPFLFISIFSFIQILIYFNFNFKEKLIGILLFFSIPAVVTQASLVSYDFALLAFYLLGFYAILRNKFLLFTITCLCLCVITLRGVFAVMSLFAVAFYLYYQQKRDVFRYFYCVVPAVIFCIVWYTYHYIETGYFLQADNGWSAHRNFASLNIVIKNFIAIARTLFDFGIIVLLIVNIVYFRKMKRDKFLFFWLFPFFIFSMIFVFVSNPINHRYYLIVYVLMLLPTVKMLSKQRNAIIFVFIILLQIGNFQIYGNRISNGWDCTLLHAHFFKLKSDFDRFLNAKHIDKTEVGTVFPIHASRQQYYFSDDTVRMQNVHDKDILDYKYILYSNFGNDFSNQQLDELKSWKILKQEKNGFCEMILYKQIISNNETLLQLGSDQR
jgi:hypothetical protein